MKAIYKIRDDKSPLTMKFFINYKQDFSHYFSHETYIVYYRIIFNFLLKKKLII